MDRGRFQVLAAKGFVDIKAQFAAGVLAGDLPLPESLWTVSMPIPTDPGTFSSINYSRIHRTLSWDIIQQARADYSRMRQAVKREVARGARLRIARPFSVD